MSDPNSESNPKGEVLSVKRLFFTDDILCIPDYQRPYKWTTKNVSQFIQDLLEHSSKNQYQIGNMVIHNDGEKLNIVDGQQRFLTLLLILKAIGEKPNGLDTELQKRVNYYLNGNTLKFNNSKTHYNLYNNYTHIKQQSKKLFQIRTFIKKKVQIVRFILTNESEAFQFFDSQNARGKELYPHDLLKAYHLREFPAQEEEKKKEVVETWEDMKSEELAEFFEDYLFKIRGWSKGEKVWYFTNDHIEWFKGININKSETYPFVNMLRMVHNRMDEIAKDIPVYYDNRKYLFPFQLDQTIINGRRFFEMISIYKEMIDQVVSNRIPDRYIDDTAKDILQEINSYDKHERTGDTYVRNLFYASLIYYIDRFGMNGVSDAIKKLFIWSYRVRLEKQAVRVESVVNHAVENFHEKNNRNAFRLISDAIHHTNIKQLENPPIDKTGMDVSAIKKWMKELNVEVSQKK